MPDMSSPFGFAITMVRVRIPRSDISHPLPMPWRCNPNGMTRSNALTAPQISYYRIRIDKSQEEIVAKLGELKAAIRKGELKPWEFRGMKAIWFSKHLYQPLLYLDTKVVEVSPAPLNKGERQ